MMPAHCNIIAKRHEFSAAIGWEITKPVSTCSLVCANLRRADSSAITKSKLEQQTVSLSISIFISISLIVAMYIPAHV